MQHEQPEERDTDSAAREQYGTARGVEGAHGGLFRGHPGLEAVAMPADDEQRVVDTHAEADEGGERRRHIRDAEGVGKERDGHGAAGERRDGGDQRQRHAQE